MCAVRKFPSWHVEGCKGGGQPGGDGVWIKQSKDGVLALHRLVSWEVVSLGLHYG